MSDQAQSLDPSQLAALLRFYADAGVDLALDETPHDRLSEARASLQRASEVPSEGQSRPHPAPNAGGSASAASPAAPRLEALAPTAALHADQAVQDARQLAAAAQDLAALKAAMAAFEGCMLKRTATQLVFAAGVPGSRVMLVGEAPGGDEDRMGEPFVGRSGQLLDKMLAAIGLSRRENVYIANVVPWRPPGNRTPTLAEMAICEPFIRRHIELAAPDLLVTIGAPAMQTLLGIKEGILRARGQFYPFQNGARTIPALATLHPSYLLRRPEHKAFAWRDLKALKAKLAEGGAS